MRPSLRSAILGRPRRPLVSGIPADLVPSDYAVHALGDSAYYQGPTGLITTPRTVRLVLYITAIPSTSLRVIYMHESAAVHGVRVFTGNGGTTISALFGGSGGYAISPAYTITSGDLGKLMVVHAWCDTVAHLAIGGAEVGSGSSAVTVTTPASTARPTVGRFQHGAGYGADPGVRVLCVCQGDTAMTLPQVAADAAAIMSRSRGLVYPSLPGEVLRYVASDLVTSTDWHDRDGDDHTLVRTGTPTVARVP